MTVKEDLERRFGHIDLQGEERSLVHVLLVPEVDRLFWQVVRFAQSMHLYGYRDSKGQELSEILSEALNSAFGVEDFVSEDVTIVRDLDRVRPGAPKGTIGIKLTEEGYAKIAAIIVRRKVDNFSTLQEEEETDDFLEEAAKLVEEGMEGIAE